MLADREFSIEQKFKILERVIARLHENYISIMTEELIKEGLSERPQEIPIVDEKRRGIEMRVERYESREGSKEAQKKQ